MSHYQMILYHYCKNLTKKLIILLVLPTKVELMKPNEPLSVSKSVVLICKSFGSRPPATITWWKKGKFMGKAPEEVSCQDIFDYFSLFYKAMKYLN